MTRNARSTITVASAGLLFLTLSAGLAGGDPPYEPNYGECLICMDDGCPDPEEWEDLCDLYFGAPTEECYGTSYGVDCIFDLENCPSHFPWAIECTPGEN